MEIGPESCTPEQLVDLMSAMRIVHEHAAERDVDESLIHCMGFSAGAHLVGDLAERFDDSDLLARDGATAAETKPFGVAMGYHMVNMGPVCSDIDKVPREMCRTIEPMTGALFGMDAPTPNRLARQPCVPCARACRGFFAWHSARDEMVDPAETFAFFAALQAVHVSCELLLHGKGHMVRAFAAR